MSEKEIFVPLLSWLIGGSRIGGSYNIYCGSIGTDPHKGCVGREIFNYRIWIEKSDETEILKAAVYRGLSAYENQDEESVSVQCFEMCEESLPLIKQWIEGQSE